MPLVDSISGVHVTSWTLKGHAVSELFSFLMNELINMFCWPFLSVTM